MDELMAKIIDLESKRKVKTTVGKPLIESVDQDFIKEILTIALKYYNKNKLENKADAVYKMLQNWEEV
tara:strand:- start:271 stop:474 length:204 start_codon:yes stop_codon:yes gene_type:complete